MSTPDTKSATPDELSYQDQVKLTRESMTKNEESGKWEFPEGTPEHLQFAAMSEKRRLDTQADYTRGQQSLKALETEKNKLVEHLESITTVTLSDEEKTQLDELKYADPEAWRNKMNELERNAKAQLSEKLTNIGEEANKASEQVVREQQLATFREMNPDLEINDDVIENEIPPRITRKLEKGEVSFAEFLGEVGEYLKKGKVINNSGQPSREPNLGNVAGGSNPAKQAIEGDFEQSYANEIY